MPASQKTPSKSKGKKDNSPKAQANAGKQPQPAESKPAWDSFPIVDIGASAGSPPVEHLKPKPHKNARMRAMDNDQMNFLMNFENLSAAVRSINSFWQLASIPEANSNV